MEKDLEPILEDVIAVIKEAGRTVLSFYNSGDYEVKYKSAHNPVTRADLESNRIILAGLEKYGYGLLSEETADDGSRLKKSRVWIVDPLDGTRDFIEKTGEFTVMIGLVENGKPVLGVVYRPAGSVLYYATKHGGAFRRTGEGGAVRLKVSTKTDLSKFAMLSSRFHRSKAEIKFAARFGIKDFIDRGSSLKICQIAAGEGELNFNPSDKTFEWDICAADIILSEAGGRLTDANGQEFSYNKKDPGNKSGYAASNGVKHDFIISSLKELLKKNGGESR